jgi:hypothetical protein
MITPLHRASGLKPAPQFTLAATLAHAGNLHLPRLGLLGTNSADKQFIQCSRAVRLCLCDYLARAASVDGLPPE